MDVCGKCARPICRRAIRCGFCGMAHIRPLPAVPTEEPTPHA